MPADKFFSGKISETIDKHVITVIPTANPWIKRNTISSSNVLAMEYPAKATNKSIDPPKRMPFLLNASTAGPEIGFIISDVIEKILLTTPTTVAVAPRESAYLGSSVFAINCPKVRTKFIKHMLRNSLLKYTFLVLAIVSVPFVEPFGLLYPFSTVEPPDTPKRLDYPVDPQADDRQPRRSIPNKPHKESQR